MIDTAESELEAVLCLHSLFLAPRMFDQLVAAGAGRYRFVAPAFLGQEDRLGEGDDRAVTMDAAADDMWHIIDDLGLERFSIVAQSMGGDVAVRMAALQPGRIRRMVLMGTSACAEPPDQRQQFTGLVEDIVEHGYTGDKVDLLMGILFGTSSHDDARVAESLAAWRRHVEGLSPRLGAAMRGVVERTSAVDLLQHITAPTLIISGTEDVARPPAWSDQMFEHIPDAELWRLKRTGHSPLIEHPDLINAATLAFLGR